MSRFEFLFYLTFFYFFHIPSEGLIRRAVGFVIHSRISRRGDRRQIDISAPQLVGVTSIRERERERDLTWLFLFRNEVFLAP